MIFKYKVQALVPQGRAEDFRGEGVEFESCCFQRNNIRWAKFVQEE